METEKIDVPKFDGWEAFYGIPNMHEGCRILDESGTQLIYPSACDDYIAGWMQICYRKIKPNRITFECTGEHRTPKNGEWYKSFFGDYLCCHNDNFREERDIFRVVEE